MTTGGVRVWGGNDQREGKDTEEGVWGRDRDAKEGFHFIGVVGGREQSRNRRACLRYTYGFKKGRHRVQDIHLCLSNSLFTFCGARPFRKLYVSRGYLPVPSRDLSRSHSDLHRRRLSLRPAPPPPSHWVPHPSYTSISTITYLFKLQGSVDLKTYFFFSRFDVRNKVLYERPNGYKIRSIKGVLFLHCVECLDQ